ncbi:glycoside hydrolase family 30 protein [Thermophagus xiamenensis]|uniref:Glucosylceramidase n=1 Tax=Thermophagus xiamenensis TaxID=385682 RepID=A0A1I1XFY3_9BACT|nr:glycoside hydrolase family 30 protein [Thermophagus xiamenensis]SFE06277.1 glucosylceramidase [Thermophagus xiamenensis]
MKKLFSALVLLAFGFSGCNNAPNEKTESITDKLNQKGNTISATSAVVYRTAKETQDRLSKVGAISFEEFRQPLETQPCVFIDPSNTFQTFLGVGGAFTDASAEVFAKLSAQKQQELLDAYFGEKGINYTFMRTHIASCDFSSESYDYVDENDSALATFSVEHDLKYRIPFIKKAMDIVGEDFKMFVSPWSPPAWMKDNNNRLRGGKLLDKYKQSWANHYVKFIRAYEQQGIPVWGLSVQNEPMAVQRWESCIYTADDERDFVKYYLGPTLEKQGMSDKKLIVWDHNRDLIFQRASVIFNDPEASRYIWGIGFHWYETWTGSDMQFNNLKAVKEAYPDKNLVFTEGCVEAFNYDRLNDWGLGERYGKSMINDFNNGTVAWTDWNILLDENGGPNHVGNYCFAPVHANLSMDQLIYTNSYYYIGHFSKFIRPGARRISCASSRDVLQATAFMNPDGTIVVVVMNVSEEAMPFKLWMNGKAASINSLPHSIVSVVMN